MIVIATSNQHKAKEISAFLEGQEWRLIDQNWTAEETGAALVENALIKVQAAKAFCRPGEWILAEDTGLFVAALGERPGIYSARYAGENATYEQNVTKLLEEMKNIKDARQARFRTAAVLAGEGGQLWISCAEVTGRITQTRSGQGGFGYDPVFFVPQGNQTLAQMSLDEKNKISHRGRAIRALMPYVKDPAARVPINF